MREQHKNNAGDAKNTDDECLEKGNLDANAKEVDDPQDDGTDDAVRDEFPQDTKRQCNELSKDRKYNDANGNARNNVQTRFPSCFP